MRATCYTDIPGLTFLLSTIWKWKFKALKVNTTILLLDSSLTGSRNVMMHLVCMNLTSSQQFSLVSTVKLIAYLEYTFSIWIIKRNVKYWGLFRKKKCSKCFFAVKRKKKKKKKKLPFR